LPITLFPLSEQDESMSADPGTEKNPCAIYVDMGTTNTRGWLMQGGDMIARFNRPAGVRDTARDGSPQKIHTALHELVETLERQVKPASSATRQVSAPAYVAAAGMIGSPLGLAEVPHLEAPAGLAEIAAASRCRRRHDRLSPWTRRGSAPRSARRARRDRSRFQVVSLS
jgi:2-keto-3-deoxy-galactonokinase